MVRESEVKNRLKREFFDAYDWTRVIGDIDLAVCSQPRLGEAPVTFLWAETKKGSADSYESLIQLILTIGKARTFEREIPPFFLAAADAQKIAFVEYNKVMHIFTKTDFNWNVTPSDHLTKEFKELYALLHDELEKDVTVFKYAFDEPTLKKWIKKNFREGRKEAAKIPVNKNNFTFVYYDWVKTVKQSIDVDWEAFKKSGILDCDFFLADLMSVDDMSIRDKLKVVLEKTKYKILRKVESDGLFSFSEVLFKDNQTAYKQFWNRYERPPKPVYQKYILERHDLLVPQFLRETEGSYYTPEIWVRLAQEYIEKVLGENWQEEYYIWDCAAGTGNLLRGLTNKYNIFASTLYDSDVKIMHNAIDEGRLNLVKNNVFQFDFLNDGFDKCPEVLRNIIHDEEKRKKLVILINPPYLESGNARTSAGTGTNKTGATKGNKVREKYQKEIGPAANEMFALFTYRITKEIPGCVLAEFSTLKILQAPNFSEFRKKMNMNLKSLFIVPGDTFDNVKGQFPIGFHIWQTNAVFDFNDFETEAFETDNKRQVETSIGTKKICLYDNRLLLNDWVRHLRTSNDALQIVGYQVCHNNDFQNQKYINLYNEDQAKAHRMQIVVTADSLLFATVYHAVRAIPKANWLNDRDQFLYPNDGWSNDVEFQTNCLVWSIFNNVVKEDNGICHWIPFYEDEVNPPSPFNSRFMADFIHGKIKRSTAKVESGDLFSEVSAKDAADTAPIDAMSPEAEDVMDAGRELWKYYMSKRGINPNASYYDIRWYFQEKRTDKNGKEKLLPASGDVEYMRLWENVKTAVKALEKVIEPKIYEYGFLLK